MEDGDIYHWCDVGCHFNQNGISRLREYIDIVSKLAYLDAILLDSLRNPNMIIKDAIMMKHKHVNVEGEKKNMHFNLNEPGSIIRGQILLWNGN